MKNQPFLNISLLITVAFVLSACATPVAPTGGPTDSKAPVIELTVPRTGTTNFTGNTFEFQFNEYINRASVAGAITIEPDLGIRYTMKWKKRRLIIAFEEDFPDSTTIILKLGGAIADMSGNRMNRTTTIAISTGDEIDSGQISGRILQAEDGRGAAQQRIFLYRGPVNFAEKAAYEVTSDTSGAFNFSYLREGEYRALLVNDRNRNKIWDSESEFAQPFYETTITLAKNGSDTLSTIYVQQVDSLKPNLLGVGLLSTNRLRLRFSESIVLSESAKIQIADSSGNYHADAHPLYISPQDDFVLFAQSDTGLLREHAYFLSLEGITDRAGNRADTSGFEFTGSSQQDTTLQRIIGSNTQNDLFQADSIEIIYAAKITQPEILDSLVVIEGSVDFNNWPAAEISRNKLIIKPQGNWVENTDYQILAWNPVSRRRSLLKPQIWDSTQFGAIEITLPESDSSTVFQAELKSGGRLYFSGSFNQRMEISNLPPLSYTLILYEDINQNGRWDKGSLNPLVLPEPYYVQRGIKIQEGFTSQLQIIF